MLQSLSEPLLKSQNPFFNWNLEPILKKNTQSLMKFESRGFVFPGGQNEEIPGWEKNWGFFGKREALIRNFKSIISEKFVTSRKRGFGSYSDFPKG